ncbi:Rrf2 family transcriptional regulator [Pyxidicoccus parkwayensis]|uniref:Rrf2 family transcriptional regulator n=1 Tax=Pyxidicoccus parkwayensis TaxID=2813578 RepID=A0ABX7NTZ9_9BACT|nr:Rrf2 family transcriptional regulator [Pyxidicoccus parkwaysis]QSQ22250.1 Rrf2 family transcriptional regulator [Pyxidicoccus parkwaysis]
MAAHMLGMLACAEREARGSLTSESMARSIQTNPVVVRRLLRDLARAGLVETKRGVGGGVSLARGPEDITLRDVYEAVEEDAELLGRYPSGPNQTCDMAPMVADYLEGVVGRAESAFKQSLESTTLAMMSRELAARHRRASSRAPRRRAAGA